MATATGRETAHAGTLEVGELVASLRTLGDRWGWSKDRVARFMSDLTVRTAIATVRETPSGTVYRIVNYRTYATFRDTERDTERDEKRDRGETAARQEKQVTSKQTNSLSIGAPKKNGRKRAVALPKGWAPTADHRARAKASNIDIDRECERFRAHAIANGKTFKSWNAAFTTWLMRAEDFKPATTRTGSDTDLSIWED
jgi:hypothetical protein